MRLFTAQHNELHVKTALYRRTGLFQSQHYPCLSFSILALFAVWLLSSVFVFRQLENQTLALSPEAYKTLEASNLNASTQSAHRRFTVSADTAETPSTLHALQSMTEDATDYVDSNLASAHLNTRLSLAEIERLNLVDLLRVVRPEAATNASETAPDHLRSSAEKSIHSTPSLPDDGVKTQIHNTTIKTNYKSNVRSVPN